VTKSSTQHIAQGTTLYAELNNLVLSVYRKNHKYFSNCETSGKKAKIPTSNANLATAKAYKTKVHQNTSI